MPERHTMEPEEMMAYLDGELAGDRAAEAMAHLERCAECQMLAADLRRVSNELAKWQVEAPRMEAPVVRRWAWLPSIPRNYAIAAAACVLLLGVTLTMTRSRQQQHLAPLMLPVEAPTPYARRTSGAVETAAQPPAPRQTPADTGSRLKAQFLPNAPMIERSAQLTLVSRDFNQIRSSLDTILARRHGYLADLRLDAPENAGRELDASMRIPAAELDATLADLKQLGRVALESQKGEDVTRQYADLTARLANARNTESRLSQLLAQRTGKLSDVLDFEREIARVRGEIEQMDAERRATETLVAYATVQLTATENYQTPMKLGPESTLTRLRNAAVEGYKNVAGSVLDVSLVAITYGPALLLWGGLALLAGLWIRRRRRS